MCVTGSGWAPTNPTIDHSYDYYFDDVHQTTQDCSVDQPSVSFDVPQNTISGIHTVRVEMRDKSAEEAIISCKEVQAPVAVGGTGNLPFIPTAGSISIVKDPAASQAYVWQTNKVGVCNTVSLTLDISAFHECTGNQWCATLEGLTGKYLQKERLYPGVTEVTGPLGNTTPSNFCAQVGELTAQAAPFSDGHWYMLSATKAHENVHQKRLKPALQNTATNIETLVEAICVPFSGQTLSAAVAQIKALPVFEDAAEQAADIWDAEYHLETSSDDNPGGACDDAESLAVKDMVNSICNYASANGWATCSSCQ